MSKKSPVYLALDNLSVVEAIELTKKIGRLCHGVKINDAYDAHGGWIIDQLLHARANGVWVDLKIHDIPNTAANRAESLAINGASIITVHASGGIPMMKAVVERLAEDYQNVSVFAVSLLTSLSQGEVTNIYGADRLPKQVVLDLARMAKEAGVHGIVCSPQEVGMLSKYPDLYGMKLITPGVRSPGADVGDQKRVGTPKQAIADGATHIVVGRQVTEAEDPVAALNAIFAEIGEPQIEMEAP